MPYIAEISRSNPTCLMFLIDQSNSMAGPFGGQPGKKKAQGVADALNRLLQNLVLKSTKSEGVRDYFHVGVLGYGGEVRPALGGALSGQTLVPISELANNPTRVETRKRTIDDGAGGLIEQTIKFPVWFEPAAKGKTPMCAAFAAAHRAVSEFIEKHPNAFPPLVFHLTDGESTDGDPEMGSAALRSLTTRDGEVLLFNLHLSSHPFEPVLFPETDDALPDDFGKLLFNMSSRLPKRLREAATADGLTIGPHSRGFGFNADLVAVIRFLDIGTRVASLGR